jgi:hypothetical protein
VLQIFYSDISKKWLPEMNMRIRTKWLLVGKINEQLILSNYYFEHLNMWVVTREIRYTSLSGLYFNN